jgi:hypothetical protein
MWCRLRGRLPDRRFFKLPLLPSAFDDPRTAIAFSNGEFCVAVLKGRPGEGGEDLCISFTHRKSMPMGKWVGCFDVTGRSLSELKDLIDDAAEHISQESEQEE